MKSLYCVLFISVFVALFASPALAQNAPDSGMKGLWVKATALPKGTTLEDMTEVDDFPNFVYTIGRDKRLNASPAATITVRRYPQNALAKKLAKLDKKALAEFNDAVYAKLVKNLKFTNAQTASEKFGHPCQMAVYTDMRTPYDDADTADVTILFIQTDTFMFVITANRYPKGKYSETDAEKWLMNLKMVTQ